LANDGNNDNEFIVVSSLLLVAAHEYVTANHRCIYLCRHDHRLKIGMSQVFK